MTNFQAIFFLGNEVDRLKYQFWKNVTSEKWNSGTLNTFGHFLSSFLGVIAPKVLNVPEFHFSEVYFFQNWYFRNVTGHKFWYLCPDYVSKKILAHILYIQYSINFFFTMQFNIFSPQSINSSMGRYWDNSKCKYIFLFLVH